MSDIRTDLTPAAAAQNELQYPGGEWQAAIGCNLIAPPHAAGDGCRISEVIVQGHTGG